MNYFDTSALIKRFVEEPGSELVEALTLGEPTIATSKLAYAEIHAGLGRKLRAHELSATAHRRTSHLFDADWVTYIRVELVDQLLIIARDLIQRHPLRGFDAIHLASAIRLRDQLGESVQLIAADHRLLVAAAEEQLETMDVRR